MKIININDVIQHNGNKGQVIGRVTNISTSSREYGAPFVTIFCVFHTNTKYIGSYIDYIYSAVLRNWTLA